MAGPASRSKFELVDLTTPEPRRDQGSSNISSPPIIDLVTPGPALVVDPSTPELDQLVAPVVDLSTPEPGQLVAPVVDLSTPEPEQLVPALSVSARALAMSQCRPPGLQLLTPDLRRCLLNRRPHPRRNLITVGMAYHCITHPGRPYRQKWYYVGGHSCSRSLWPALPGFWGLTSSHSISGSMDTLLSRMKLSVMYAISIVRLS
jgi:hypothetical protein